MAAMARHVDDLAAFVDRLQAREIGQLDAVVQPVPQSAEHAGHEDHESVRIVGGDFVRVAARDLERVAALELLFGDILAHGVAHRLRAQHFGNDGAPVRQVRADGRRPLVAELHAQLPPDTSRPARHAARLHERRLQLHRFAHQHEQVASVEQQGEQLAEPAADVPILGNGQAEPRALAVRRATPEQAHRDDLCRESQVVRRGRRQHAQYVRHAPVDPLAEEARSSLEKEYRVVHDASLADACMRLRQRTLRADIFEHGEIDDAALLQRVDDAPPGAQARADIVG